MRINGKLKKLLDPEVGKSKNGKEWKKQCFIIDTGAQFNPDICITAFNKEIDLIKGIKEGDQVNCQVNISSREYNGKWYHNINLWQIDINTESNSEDNSEYPF